MTISVPYTFVPDTTIASSQVNTNFQSLVTAINDIPPPVALQAFRNRIINGTMIVDQRNAGAAQNSLVSGAYTLDRWKYGATGDGKFNSQQNAGAVTPTVGFPFYLGLTSTASTAVGSTDYYTITQFIEGNNVLDLGFGTASAQSVSLSFWVYSSLTGTFAGALRNGAINRSYVFTYLIGSANTWTNITIPNIPGDVSGTWAIDTTAGITVIFSLGGGSTYQTTPGVWQTGNFIATSTSVNVVSTNGAVFYITGVQFEPGTVCTSFENRLYIIDILLCQRYYTIGQIYLAAYTIITGTIATTYTLPTRMRTTPTLVITTNASINLSSPTLIGAPGQIFGAGAATATGTTTVNFIFTASAEL